MVLNLWEIGREIESICFIRYDIHYYSLVAIGSLFDDSVDSGTTNKWAVCVIAWKSQEELIIWIPECRLKNHPRIQIYSDLNLQEPIYKIESIQMFLLVDSFHDIRLLSRKTRNLYTHALTVDGDHWWWPSCGNQTEARGWCVHPKQKPAALAAIRHTMTVSWWRTAREYFTFPPTSSNLPVTSRRILGSLQSMEKRSLYCNSIRICAIFEKEHTASVVPRPAGGWVSATQGPKHPAAYISEVIIVHLTYIAATLLYLLSITKIYYNFTVLVPFRHGHRCQRVYCGELTIGNEIVSPFAPAFDGVWNQRMVFMKRKVPQNSDL